MVSEKKLSDINFERLKKALTYKSNKLIDSDDDMYLTAADSLIDIKNIITGSNNIFLRKGNVQPCGHEKINVDKI